MTPVSTQEATRTVETAGLPGRGLRDNSSGTHGASIHGAVNTSRPSLLTDYMAFFKVRVTTLVVITAWAGYYLGSEQSGVSSLRWGLLGCLLGIGMISGSAASLNEILERNVDRKMKRTAARPLPSGRMSLGHALLASAGSIVLGSLILAASTNLLTLALTLATAFTYSLIYTPLKRISPLATFIGAFPGAMPPLLGWVAARGAIEWPAVALMAILFVWQFPHFMSIAWLYREDYARAGIRMLPAVEPDGGSTVSEALIYAVLMIPVSLVPYYLGVAGTAYAVAAILLGLLYLAFTVRFTGILHATTPKQSRGYAYGLLKASVIYLPLLLGIMMVSATGRR